VLKEILGAPPPPPSKCARIRRRDCRAAFVAKRVDNLSHLRDLGQQVNRKLLEVERLSHRAHKSALGVFS